METAKYTDEDFRTIERILIYDDDKDDSEKIEEVLKVIEYIIEKNNRLQAIANAKLVLKQAGFFVDNLWHVDDVKNIEDVSSEVAQDIIEQAVFRTMQDVNNEIQDIINDRKF